MNLESHEVSDDRQYADYCLDNNGKSIHEQVEDVFRPSNCPFAYCPHTFMYCQSGQCPSSNATPEANSAQSCEMIKRKSCQEFRDTGLLLIINQFLHIFGWSIVVDVDGDELMYPARVKFRGFDNKTTAEAYVKVSKYMKSKANELFEEIMEKLTESAKK